MALLPSYNSRDREIERRTNMRLTISGHNAPAEPLVVDAKLPVTFSDVFGGHAYLADKGQVLIGKGRLVSILRGDFNRGKYGDGKLTVANGHAVKVYPAAGSYPGYTQPAVWPMGLNFQHVYLSVDDLFSGNQPVFVTDEFFEVPLVENAAAADPIKTGVAYGSVASFEFGDYVMPDSLGRIIPWDGVDIRNAVGKTVGLQTDVPPRGWLEWVMMPKDKLADEGLRDVNYPTLKPDSYNPVTNQAAYPYNPEFAWPLYDDARGIEQLTDGSFFGNVQYTSEAVVNADGTPATVNNVAVGTVYTWYVKNPPISEKDSAGNPRSPIITVVTLDTTDITADCVFDYKTGKITYTVTAGNVPTLNDTVAATYFRGPGIPGIPRNWDEAGALGALRVLLII